MICEKCKTQIPDDSKYCKECGVKLPPPQKTGMTSSQSIPPPTPPPIIVPPSPQAPLPKPAPSKPATLRPPSVQPQVKTPSQDPAPPTPPQTTKSPVPPPPSSAPAPVQPPAPPANPGTAPAGDGKTKMQGTATELGFNEPKSQPTQPAILKFKVVFKVVSGPLGGKKYSIDEPAVINIGRGSDCMIRITKEMDPVVSRHHCKLEIAPPKVELSDLGSSNGTHINSQQLEANKKYALNSGDTFKVGDSVFSVEIKTSKTEIGATQE